MKVRKGDGGVVKGKIVILWKGEKVVQNSETHKGQRKRRED